MSKLRYIIAVVLVTLLGVATVYLCCSVIDEGIQRRTEESESETDEIVFTHIESTMSQEEDVSTDRALPEIEAECETISQQEIAENTAFFAPRCENLASEDDLMLLARLITNEAGSDWCTDEHQRAVASVVLNRVADARFPGTIYDVIMQGQNGECAIQYAIGSIERFNTLEVSERALSNAQYVLTYGSTVGDAVWQAEAPQGETVAVFDYGSSVTYIGR